LELAYFDTAVLSISKDPRGGESTNNSST